MKVCFHLIIDLNFVLCIHNKENFKLMCINIRCDLLV